MIENQYDIEQAFPAVPCPVKPLGARVTVQMRFPKNKTKSGLILTAETAENMYRNEQTAKVVALGAGCFRWPDSGEPWASGPWYQVGDFVRVPLYGGDNHWVEVDGNLILFKTFKDLEVIGLIEGSPLDVKTNMAYF